MNKGKRLAKNTLIISVGKFSTQLVSFFLLPVYTSILTDAEYGTFDYINSLAVFLIPCITLLMEEAMFRFLIDSETYEEKKNVMSQALLLISINLGIVSIILFLILSIIGYEYKIYLILYMFASIYNSFSQSFLRGLGKVKLFSISAFTSSVMTLMLNIVFIVFLKSGVKGLLLAFITSNILTPTIIFIKLKIWEYLSLKKVNIKQMREMLKYSIPLVPNSISWSIINLSDRLIVTNFLGASSNGILAVAHKFPNIMNTIYGYFYTAWKEEASRAIKEDNPNKFYNYIYDILSRFLIAISLGMISILPFVFNIFVNESFNEAYKYIPLLVIAMYFGNISGFYGGIFSANKKTKIMGTTTIFSAVINIVINILLIKSLGIYATIASTFIANLTVCIYRYIKLKELVVLKNNYKLYLSTIVILIITTICYYSSKRIVNIIGFSVMIVYVIYINKNVLLSILLKVKEKIRR